MDFDFTDEQRMIQDMARDFAQNEVKPKAAQIDKEGKFPRELVNKMGELGLMGVAIPQEYGGSAMDNISYVIALEEICAACASTGVVMSVNNSLFCDPIMNFGTEEQKQKWLKPVASGQKVGCFALSEPSTGSDAAAQKTIAVKEGDYYILNGTKNFITNGKEAEISIIFAMTDKEKGHKGITTFLVSADNPGYEVGKEEEKLGIKGSSTTQIILENCKVSADQVLGGVGNGFKVAMSTLDGGRIGISAQAVGIARDAFETAVKYSKEREAFGKPICSFQALQWMMADMATDIDASRLLTYRAAKLKDQKKPFSKQAAMAKVFSAEASMRTTTKAIQILGGYGYCKEYSVERNFRDAKITEIYEGTSEIQRLVIASSVLKEL